MTDGWAAGKASQPILFAGRTTLDVLYWLDRLPEEDTKVFARAFRAAPGGPACNAAITCALLGGNAVLLSAIGSGTWADVVRAKLAARGVKVIDLAEGRDYEMPLTTVLAASESSTRTIVNPPLAPVQLKVLAPEWNAAWGDLPGVVLTDGFHLQDSLPLIGALREGGAAICLDGGSWKAGTEMLAPLLSVAICSERFQAPGQARGAEEILEWWNAQGVQHVAVTRGARSIVGIDEGRSFEIEIAPVQAVDTLGAGDVLHGAFCYAYARTADFEGSLRRAAEIATRSCQGLGIECWAGDELNRLC